ncbi:MAG: hypothetical protein ACRYG4_14820 [Janthinobacterium lividum]
MGQSPFLDLPNFEAVRRASMQAMRNLANQNASLTATVITGRLEIVDEDGVVLQSTPIGETVSWN